MEPSPVPDGVERPAPPPPSAPEEGAITEVERYELDGIPLFHLPMAGATILTLAFGVGRAAEPVVCGGMTHLAEHLILTSIADALDHSNGSTEAFRVTFTVRGAPAEASRFLRDVCAAIERPPLSRMHQEANVLRTEAAGRQGPMPMSLRLMWYRTGFQGIGTVHLPELFLRRLDEELLRSWIAENMVAGNAAIWIAGELPDDLLVFLPPGPRRPPPPVGWIPGLETPTLIIEDAPAVGASFFVERNFATAAGFRTLERHLRRALRVDRGLGYDVGSDYVPVSADNALISLWATCLPNSVAEVERLTLEAIDDIAARGPSSDELADQYQQFMRASLDPMSIPGRLDAQVRNLLLGGQPETMFELADGMWRLEPDEVAAAFKRARDSMLLLIPTSGRVPQRPFRPYPGPIPDAMGHGRTFELVTPKQRGRWGKEKPPKLTVAASGVALDGSDGRRVVGMHWDDMVAVICEQESRSLVARDGNVVYIYASEWRDGRDAIRLVDRFAPRGVVVPLAS
jgi:hypothetical protein